MTAALPYCSGGVLTDRAAILSAGSGHAETGFVFDLAPYLPEFSAGPDFDKLVESIRLKGILDPLTLAKSGNLVNGNRRYLAAVKLGLPWVPFVVNPAIDSPEKEVAAIFDTETASPRNALDHAKMLLRFMKEHSLDQRQVAIALKMSEPSVSAYLKILKQSPAVQDAVGDGRLTRQHIAAVAILPIERQDELLLGALSQVPATSAAKLKAMARPKRQKKPDARFRRLSYSGVGVVVPAGMSAAQVIAALGEALADAGAKLKQTPKSKLMAGDIFNG